ncbi:hypothetical protein EC396_08595 [Lutibacter sp. HS1-25]|uniref:hypothetical protein n=1 Tax=Lutibacter sp. HS1-25 TaxID=2485000 RepID=UPI0010123800|nr:hypothetical protein [Lutibacter sp. HS1-25]RXP55126.1 hypothetical protein EC396_08595 [Lutibacter sp. HS1-25]
MAFSFSKLFQPKQTVNYTEILNQIDYKEGTKFAENETTKIYIDIEELGGFPYLKTVVFGIHEINIKRTGCTITFVFENEELTLSSDNTTIESNQIQKSGIYATLIDFELNEDEAKKIQNQKVIEVKYQFKKESISLQPIHIQ